jgi:hypothetical protein
VVFYDELYKKKDPQKGDLEKGGIPKRVAHL